MTSYRKNNLYWISWGLLIFGLISVPGNLIPEPPKLMNMLEPDKLVHLFLFLVFIILILRAFTHKDSPFPLRKNALFFALLLSVFISGITEIIQHFFIPNRIASLYDYIANILGCLTGLGIFVYRYKSKKVS